jgi:hypothetical protein
MFDSVAITRLSLSHGNTVGLTGRDFTDNLYAAGKTQKWRDAPRPPTPRAKSHSKTKLSATI